jgi:nucleotide-binding universal stress UspA family protein
VLYAEDPLLCAAARINGTNLSQEAGRELKAFIDASVLPPGIVVHQHVVGGPAADVIRDIACREQVDVVVVGTHGASGVERLVFGSTAEAVLRRSTIPVLLVPHTWVPPNATLPDLSGTGPVIVALDFTAGSLQALAAGFRLARTLHTSLTLLHVVQPMQVIDRWKAHAEVAVQQRVQEGRSELTRVARGLAMDVAVDTRLETGPVPECIASVAQSDGTHHPLLVLGRRLPHGRGDAPGSIAHRVAALARVPTLMFMADDTEE